MTQFFILLDSVLLMILIKMFFDIFKSLHKIRQNPEYQQRLIRKARR